MNQGRVNIFFAAALIFVALVLGVSLAHLLAFPNKIGLTRNEYLVSQQIYRGWSLVAIVVIGALFSTLSLAIVARSAKQIYIPALVSFLFIAIAQAIFWIYTYPANQQTNNWGYLPDNWMELRRQWEYSHAAGAILNFIAFIILIIAVLNKNNAPANTRKIVMKVVTR
jgi:hypothetical protein